MWFQHGLFVRQLSQWVLVTALISMLFSTIVLLLQAIEEMSRLACIYYWGDDILWSRSLRNIVTFYDSFFIYRFSFNVNLQITLHVLYFQSLGSCVLHNVSVTHNQNSGACSWLQNTKKSFYKMLHFRDIWVEAFFLVSIFVCISGKNKIQLDKSFSTAKALAPIIFFGNCTEA